MFTLPDYDIREKLYESDHSLIYRGKRGVDGHPIIFKTLIQDYPSPEEIVRFRQEYEMTCQFEDRGVIKAYSLEKHKRSLAIILEDFGGESLAKTTSEPPIGVKRLLASSHRDKPQLENHSRAQHYAQGHQSIQCGLEPGNEPTQDH